MKKMNVLILGSGGREHVYAWKLSAAQNIGTIFIAPGNAGTAQHGTNVALNITDFEDIATFCLQNRIDMIIPGSEDALVAGITDFFAENEKCKHILIPGPPKQGALLEGSKDFSKQFMQRYGIPTAKYQTFTTENIEKGYQFIDTLQPPFVLKADGLAAGKGVIITNVISEAKETLKEMLLGRKFGNASSKVVIEEYLNGIELSCFVLTDGKSFLMLPEAKDYKRIGEGDTGLNTGGMGAVSPVPFATDVFLQKVIDNIVKPTLDGLTKEGISYKGFIFIGLMNVQGEPYVIEYNVRMGDPETEVVFPRIENDLLDLFVATCNGTLDEHILKISAQTATTVFTVSEGYPGDYIKGKTISGLDNIKNAIIFQAGTRIENDKTVTSGGRVIAFTAMSNTFQEALHHSLTAANTVQFEGKYFRSDIGKDLLYYLQQNN